jgi:rhamnose utilization protein RhaD (predicted bifunctional aldolase and dehydrogenase)/NAD(P)-dependent dehydrogenase (short-subunit alcohol dehydrogenase family)
MRNRWDDDEAVRWTGPVGECTYGSHLIGREPTLVLHGGGNTSVKAPWRDVTGEDVEALHVKGSGWDLASIEPAGFAPLPLARLRALAGLDELGDREMMAELSASRLDPTAPQPSVETLLHATLPHAAVQHSHADAILTLTNLADGERRARDLYGVDVVVVPYVMPGFDLAKAVAELWEREGGPDTLGMVLLSHGLFTFGASAREAYARHVELITMVEDELDRVAPVSVPATPPLSDPDPVALASLRRELSRVAGRPMVVSRHDGPAVRALLRHPDLERLTQQGPLTPDHVIRTKRVPLLGRDVESFAAAYRDEFARFAHRGRTELTMLDPAPRVVLDPDLGMLAAGPTAKDAGVAADIYHHTVDVLLRAESLGGYRALPPEHYFDLEYWELEQAKLVRHGSPPPLAGEVAVVTGAASGIGRACAEALLERGAAVVGLDVDEEVAGVAEGHTWLGLTADVTDPVALRDAVRRAAARFGGVDLAVLAAGVFGPSEAISGHDHDAWRSVLDVNLEGTARLLDAVHPLLARAPRHGRVALVGSKNVRAPGAGAGAYSASKAGATQLARVAALEWATDGIRVNVVHPDAVFDTGLWTEERLAERAARYGMTVEQYRRRNLLGTEVRARDVARVVADLLDPAYQAVTGAQIAIDGGSDRTV